MAASRLRYLLSRALGRRPIQRIEHLEDHESGLRRLMADAGGKPYRALQSLAEAQAHDDGLVVMEGDYGGQIYLTCPARLVRCDEPTLEHLLADLDNLEWKDPEGARVFYERVPAGQGIVGGMGGGAVMEGVWVHETFRKLRLETAIRDVVEGRRARVR